MDLNVNLMAVDVNVLISYVLIIAIASMGNVQWLKNFIKPEKKRAYAVIAMIVLCVNANMQMPYIPKWITVFWNLITLGNAVMQFGKDALIDGIPSLINKAMNNTQPNKRRENNE